jgi:hypothetical protein
MSQGLFCQTGTRLITFRGLPHCVYHDKEQRALESRIAPRNLAFRQSMVVESTINV